MPVRTVIERGPKGKRSVAFGIDWRGWSRGAKCAELALETHHPHRKRVLREAGRLTDTGGRGAHPGRTAAASGGLRRGDARVQRRGGQAAHAVVDAAVPHPPL